MECSCTITDAPQSTLAPNLCAADHSPRVSSPAASPVLQTAPSRRFYCLCTVCGLDLPEVPTVTCDTCGSQTHITCARDAYSHEWLFMEVVAGASAGSGTAQAGVSTSSATRESVPAGSPTSVSPGMSHAASLTREACAFPGVQMPSVHALTTAAAKIGKEYHYYCHPDCAMGMEVVRNPQFNATLSARIEAAFALDWRRTWEILAANLSDVSNLPGSWEAVETLSQGAVSVTASDAQKEKVGEESEDERDGPTALHDAGSPSHARAPASVFDQLHLAAQGNTALAHELSYLYSQLRAEAWADYFEQERHHSGHPLFYPPSFVDVEREAAFNYVLEATSPHGQAARLYLLDPATHPVGSAVAIPAGVLARWQQPSMAPLIKVNDSNNFVAEAVAVVVGEAVTPATVTVYRSCKKEGRVLAAP